MTDYVMEYIKSGKGLPPLKSGRKLKHTKQDSMEVRVKAYNRGFKKGYEMGYKKGMIDCYKKATERLEEVIDKYKYSERTDKG